ncbi:glycerol-3-phosphate responsive antiterminator [Halalkalibacter urbisdiaboli]|uniref:glycerol-3-phosphate responsive antiterminator n=1 Tax=Halalkalibacter urbisdiaboli TaxID=1960589 RepID=UPI000B44F202|nr:glycerol-3-phosphate responsive antiterminator [Halalkalibacter urbisdiaboli]
MTIEANRFLVRLKECKKIAAVKKPKQLELAVKYKDRLSGVFILTGNINLIKKYVELLRKEGLPTFVHIEKIKGLSNDKDGLDYIESFVKPTGIVTTKPSLIAAAKKRKLLTVQRIFMIDTEIIENLPELLEKNRPDIIEIMPARIPEIIQEIKEYTDNIPLITGGLLTEKQHAIKAIEHGAVAVSTSNVQVWKMDLTRELQFL